MRHPDDARFIDSYVEIHESDGDDLLVSAPDTQGIGQYVGAEPASFTDISIGS